MLAITSHERLPIDSGTKDGCRHGCKHMVVVKILGGHTTLKYCEVDAFYLGRSLMDTATSRDRIKIT
jgi:hypothetical protein